MPTRTMSMLMGGAPGSLQAGGDAGNPYLAKVLGYSPGALWVFDDAEGDVVTCSVNAQNNGAWPGDGHTKANQAGPGGYVNVATFGGSQAELVTNYFITTTYVTGAPATIFFWLKPNSADLWTDGSNRWIMRWRTDGNNNAEIYKSAGDDVKMVHVVSGLSKTGTKDMSSLAPAGWTAWAWTWDRTGNFHKHYYQGVGYNQQTYWDVGYNKAHVTMEMMGFINSDFLGSIAYLGFWNSVLPTESILDLSTMV